MKASISRSIAARFAGPILVGAAIIALVVLSAGGVRGSDQYWYVADVESLAENFDTSTSNIFPVSVLTTDNIDIPRPFVHNSLPVYLVAPFAVIFGAYWGWLVFNLLAALLTALLINRLVARHASKGAAVAAAVAFLLLPVTFWNTTQPLLEPFLALMVAGAVYWIDSAGDSLLAWSGISVLLGLMALSRDVFLVPLVAIPAYYYVTRRDRPGRLFQAAALLGVSLGIFTVGSALLEPHTSCDLAGLLRIGVSGEAGNMGCYFNPEPEYPSLWQLAGKAGVGLRQQFVPLSAVGVLFYIPFNLLVITVGALWWRARDRSPVTLMAGLLVVLHFVTAIAFQNQPRYLLLAVPPLLAAIAIMGDWALDWRRSRYLRMAAMIAIGLGLIVNLGLALVSRSDGGAEREARSALAGFVETVLPPGEDVFLEWSSSAGSLSIGYTLRDRLVAFLSDDYTADQYEQLADSLGFRWLIAPSGSELAAPLNANLESEALLPEPYGAYAIYSLP